MGKEKIHVNLVVIGHVDAGKVILFLIQIITSFSNSLLLLDI